MPDPKTSCTLPPETDPIDRLFDGIRAFRHNVFPEQRERFKELAKSQKPRVLFITCSDSRVMPEMITQTEPGELFVCRNIGNIVPAYGETMGGVSAVVEYAVVGLHVTDIVVCGHSNCGAMAGLIRDPAKLDSMPTVRSWLHNARAARSVVDVLHPELEGEDKVQALVEQNVVTQLQNLGTHPAVAAGVASGKLKLHGWVYDIETGAVRLHDASGGTDEVAPCRWTPMMLSHEVLPVPKTRPPYAPEFRQKMVDLVRAGLDPENLAREFEPSAQVIRNWVAEADRREGRREPKPAAADVTLTSAEQDELAHLRRENKQLRLEREILSRAAAWFARETGVVPPGSSHS